MVGVVPRSGELQQLWWFLEKGVVGDPRVTVEGFRDVLLGERLTAAGCRMTRLSRANNAVDCLALTRQGLY